MTEARKRKVQFSPTENMITAAKALFTAMAWVQTIRPIVEGYESKILAEMQAGPDPKYCTEGRGMKVTDIILDPKASYHLSEKDFKHYLEECNKERGKAGLEVDDPEKCPLLVAESLQRQAERVLIEEMEPVTHLTTDQLLSGRHALENYRKFIDLTLRLLAPFVEIRINERNPVTIPYQ